jgi:hypothetical protein
MEGWSNSRGTKWIATTAGRVINSLSKPGLAAEATDQQYAEVLTKTMLASATRNITWEADTRYTAAACQQLGVRPRLQTGAFA